jgi:hypothetical protein
MSKNKRKVKSEKQANNKKRSADKAKAIDLDTSTTLVEQFLPTKDVEQKTPPVEAKKIEQMSRYDDRLLKVPIGSLWMHYKAARPGGDKGVYVIVETSLCEKTGELFVTYMSLTEHSLGYPAKWTRSFEDFTQVVTTNDVSVAEDGSMVVVRVPVPRFRLLASAENLQAAANYVKQKFTGGNWLLPMLAW